MTRDVRRVLIVDEDNVTRQIIAAMFSLDGFDVTMAANGRECMDIASAAVPDVIMMNAAGAYERYCDIAIQLRKNPETSQIKVVLVTSPAQHGEFSCTAADAHLAMPFDIGEAIEAVRALGACRT
jgi:two-component system, OmpR family, response regulator